MKLLHDPAWRDRWEWIRTGLQEVIARTDERWLPEDVYHALSNRAAFLFLIGDVGFCVVQPIRSSFEQVLFVWALWAPAGSMREHYNSVMAQLDEVARAEKLGWVRMHSPRDGWLATKLFVPVSTIYEREVTQ